MESDFPNAEPVHRFVKNFISVWDDRYNRLLAASANSDRTAALEILLSIKVSSVMIGAAQLRSVAEAIESRLRKGSTRVPESLLNDLAECGNRTIRHLTDAYLRSNRNSA